MREASNKAEMTQKKKAGFLPTLVAAAALKVLSTGDVLAAEPATVDRQEAPIELAMRTNTIPDSLLAVPGQPIFNNAHIDTAGTYILNESQLIAIDEAGTNEWIIVYLLLENLEDLYNTNPTEPVVVNLQYNGNGGILDGYGSSHTGTFPLLTYTDSSCSHILGGLGCPYAVGVGLGGKSNP